MVVTSLVWNVPQDSSRLSNIPTTMLLQANTPLNNLRVPGGLIAKIPLVLADIISAGSSGKWLFGTTRGGSPACVGMYQLWLAENTPHHARLEDILGENVNLA